MRELRAAPPPAPAARGPRRRRAAAPAPRRAPGAARPRRASAAPSACAPVARRGQPRRPTPSSRAPPERRLRRRAGRAVRRSGRGGRTGAGRGCRRPRRRPRAPAFEWPPSTRLSYCSPATTAARCRAGARCEWIRARPALPGARGRAWSARRSRRCCRAAHDQRRRTRRSRPGAAALRRGDQRVDVRSPRRIADALRARPRRARQRPQARAAAGRAGRRQPVHAAHVAVHHPAASCCAWAAGRVPLALPRRVDRWVYDVLGEESAAHAVRRRSPRSTCKPRRASAAGRASSRPRCGSRPSCNTCRCASASEQDAETYVDLMIASAAQQTAGALNRGISCACNRARAWRAAMTYECILTDDARRRRAPHRPGHAEPARSSSTR